jgi:hypothetical protein
LLVLPPALHALVDILPILLDLLNVLNAQLVHLILKQEAQALCPVFHVPMEL